MPPELVKTGIYGLDQLLSGGFIKGSTVLVSGNYGAGKTLMALQYAFYQASRGERVLYVSTSEPVFKVRQFASSLDFYDDSLLYAGYRDASPKKNARASGSVEFIESSMGIITGLHFADEGSLIEEIRNMVEGKGIQHLIIDPITTITMLYESEIAMRKDILLMGAWLTRLGCTVLLTAEESDSRLLDVEKYLADCVITLNSQMRDHEREYHIAVQKLRGNRQNMSGHLYTVGRDGVNVIQDLTRQHAQDTLRRASTGIPGIDRVARIDYGTAWLIAVDGRANVTPVLESVVAEGLARGDGIVYAPPAGLSFTAAEEGLRRYGVDLANECSTGNVLLVDYYGRNVPARLSHHITDAGQADEDKVVAADGGRSDRRTRAVIDLNGQRYAQGPDAMRRQIVATLSRARERGDLWVGYGNLAEMEPELAGFIRQACDGVMEVCVRDRYQFLRVTRSPDGFVSSEQVLVPSDNKPYIRLQQK
ncbi:MAG: circadian clock protein KaiC [Methanocella sp. PtaU1.Bin125]|nr:MAG: circadian clock protein KaiC [Methanocella sp. PtaU1.Bin125]